MMVRACTLLVGALLLTPSDAPPKVVETDAVIDKIQVKESDAGGKWEVVVRGSVTLGSAGGKLAKYTFFLTDPEGRTVPAETATFIAPDTGKTVKVSFKPLGGATSLKGKWKATMQVDDTSGSSKLHVKSFNVPAAK